MKIISPTLHGYLDYTTVALFFLAPSFFGLSGMAGGIAYALAVIHLALTVVTDFPLGVYKIISFPIHGWVERVVGPVLVLLPFALGFGGAGKGFYIVVGIAIVLVGWLTDYNRTP
ncbi:MAG: hypothetical protein ACU826_10255 [Gammaproteobacteria bacterium]